MRDPSRESGLNETIGRILQVGIILSASLIAIGLVLMVAAPPSGAPATLQGALSSRFGGSNLGTSAWLSGVSRGGGLSFLQLGTLVLLATPLVRVGASVLLFLRVGDTLYVGVTLLVLVMLLLAIVVIGPAEA